MFTLEPKGIYLAGDVRFSKLIPYEEIVRIRKINLLQSIIMGLNPFQPGMSETYMGVCGDPFHLLLIETDIGGYLLRGEDLDTFIIEAKKRIPAYQAT